MNSLGSIHPLTHAPLIWLVPAVLGAIALVTINKWLPDPLASYHAEEARQLDVENEAVCRRFVANEEQLTACKTEIMVLRQKDRDLGAFF
jgi:hypothetical protein